MTQAAPGNRRDTQRMVRRVNPDVLAATPAGAAPWRPPPPDLVLGGDEVHVWRADLADLEAVDAVAPAAGILTPDERERAAHVQPEGTRRRFVATRAALRHILARYVDATPQAIRFAYGADGKPTLAAGSGHLQFNLSHSDTLALCAVTRDRAVGIDVERIRSSVRIDGIAARFFPAAEAAALRALPERPRLEAFFASWVRKEAWIKATGKTIWRGLGDAARLSTDGSWTDAFGRWQQVAVDAGAGYAAALVVAGGPVRVACWELTRIARQRS